MTLFKSFVQSINEDIHELNQQCLEGFATLEACKKRSQCQRDDAYNLLLASRPLDPLSEKKMRCDSGLLSRLQL